MDLTILSDTEETQLFDYLAPSQRLDLITDVLATLAIRSALEGQSSLESQPTRAEHSVSQDGCGKEMGDERNRGQEK